jgi:hypothetical protein
MIPPSDSDLEQNAHLSDLLEERRTRARADVGQLLVDGIRAACDCGWGKNRGNNYELIRSSNGPSKMLEVPILDIIHKMEEVSTEDMKPVMCKKLWREHEIPTHSETLSGKLEAMRKKVGICLDCIRSRDATTSCRFQHK